MPIAVREQVVSAIQARLATLAPAVIGRGEVTSSQRPAIMIWDTLETATHRNSSVHCVNQIGVEYVADKVSDSTGNELLAAVIQVMGATDPTFAGLVDSCRYTGASIEYPESGSGLVGARVTFEVKYSFASGDPFNKP